MKLAVLIALLAPLACLRADAFTVYNSLVDWQAAVGPHVLEDFDGQPDQLIPLEGGSIHLFSGFSLVADGNHASDNINDLPFTHCPGIVDHYLCGDIHSGESGTERPTFNQLVFDEPINALGFDPFSIPDSFGIYWPGGASPLIDSDDTFFGVVFDIPTTTINFSTSDYEGFAIDNLRWQSVPEPSTALLVALGLAAIASRRLISQ